MSERPRPARPRVLLRFVGIVVAFALTILAAWLIALGHSQRQVQLGVISGLWAALIGALTLFGGQRHANAMASSTSFTGSEVEVRQNHALELQREVAARRAYEQQLHEMVRREMDHIQQAMADQIGQLREDVSGLRGDLVEKVGGQIRLERIETTRVIGSDIEALQNEVRRLAVARGSGSVMGSGFGPGPGQGFGSNNGQPIEARRDPEVYSAAEILPPANQPARFVAPRLNPLEAPAAAAPPSTPVTPSTPSSPSWQPDRYATDATGHHPRPRPSALG